MAEEERCTNCGHSREDHKDMLERALGCKGSHHCDCPSYVKHDPYAGDLWG